jgi:hypothetical protein
MSHPCSHGSTTPRHCMWCLAAILDAERHACAVLWEAAHREAAGDEEEGRPQEDTDHA